MSCRYKDLLAVMLIAGGLAVDADAQVLGTFRWQLQPFCNIVSLVVTQTGGVFTLDGFDDQCGFTTRAPATGVATLNPDGTIAFGVNIVVTPGGSPIHVAAIINIATLDGRWSDQTGGSGNFVFTPGAGTVGEARFVGDTPQFIPNAFTLQRDGGFLAVNSGAGDIPASGSGTRMMWYASKGAFRAGRVGSSEWDDANIGDFSVAFNRNTRATGMFSAAFGLDTVAAGQHSAAFGFQSRAEGVSSFAAGTVTRASGGESVAMGDHTEASAASAVALGTQTKAGGVSSFAMGITSIASGTTSIAAGLEVRAIGDRTVALGSFARALPAGSFIFGDASSNGGVVFAPAANSFTVRASGGYTLYTSPGLTTGATLAAGGSGWGIVSDANMKENFRDLHADDVLSKIARMPVREWNYTTQDASIRHVGPTAQDFHAAFGLGEDRLRINTIDADGIALAGVKALEARTREADERNRALQAELAVLRERLTQLEQLLLERR